MSFGKKKKLLSIFTVFTVILLNINSVVSAEETIPDYIENKTTAYLDYDPAKGTYSFTDESGEQLGEEFYETVVKNNVTIADEEQATEAVTEPVVTTAPQQSQTANTVIGGTVVVTKTTTKALSPAQTVPVYTGRYRGNYVSQWEGYLNTYTTTTTTTTKVTTTTTASKSVYNGIDVSRYQGIINWKKVKASGIDFVMIRAGYGMEYDQVDGNFHVNIKGAQSAGVECGVYWYSYALNEAEALKEAKVCYDTIKQYKLTYPVAFDIEDPSQAGLSKDKISNITKTFCDYLESKNYYVSVYSYASMLNDKMNSSVLNNYDIWVAHTKVSKPNFSGSYGMWQYSWTGKVNGISGDVDMDYGYKNYPYIIKNGKFSGNK